MSRDYEELYNLESMDDSGLRSLIEQELSEHSDIEAGDVRVSVEGRQVTVEGRVGTELEYQAIEHVITDLIGLKDVTNDLVVDALRRDQQPEAADTARAERNADGDAGSDGAGDNTSDEAQHLMEDTAGEQFGTSDPSEAIERGFSYHPPDSPPQEGTLSKENH